MGKLIAAAVLLFIAFSLLLTAATVRAQRPGPASNLLRVGGYVRARAEPKGPGFGKPGGGGPNLFS